MWQNSNTQNNSIHFFATSTVFATTGKELYKNTWQLALVLQVLRALCYRYKYILYDQSESSDYLQGIIIGYFFLWQKNLWLDNIQDLSCRLGIQSIRYNFDQKLTIISMAYFVLHLLLKLCRESTQILGPILLKISSNVSYKKCH